MSNKTKLPDEVVQKILKARDALVIGEKDEAYHQLYGIASPRYDSYSPWREMELQINHPFRYEDQIKINMEVTAYATKLHEAQQENERLKKVSQGQEDLYWKVVAERDKLKERCEKMGAALKAAEKQAIEVQENHFMLVCPNPLYLITEALREGESNTPAHGEGKEVVKIKTGLMFRNVHMPNHSFEIHSVDPANNKLAVNIRSANRLCWTEIDWNLEHTQWAFEKGEYYIPK